MMLRSKTEVSNSKPRRYEMLCEVEMPCHVRSQSGKGGMGSVRSYLTDEIPIRLFLSHGSKNTFEYTDKRVTGCSGLGI